MARLPVSSLLRRALSPLRLRPGRLAGCRKVSAAEALEERVLPAPVVSWQGRHAVEVVGRSAAGEWWSTAYDDDGTSETALYTTWDAAMNWIDVRFGDFDGDSLADIAGRHPVTGAWWVTLSDAFDSTTKVGGVWRPDAGWSDVGVAKLVAPDELDGTTNFHRKQSLVGRTAAGYWWAAVSNGDGTFTNRLLTWWDPAARWRDVRLLDVNQDGAADIIGRTAGGAWWAALSRGGLTYENVLLARWQESLGWQDVSASEFFFGPFSAGAILARTSDGNWWALRFEVQQTGQTPVNPVVTTHRIGAWDESAGWQDVSVGRFRFGVLQNQIVGRAANGDWWMGAWNGDELVTHLAGHWDESAGWRDVRVATTPSGWDMLVGRAGNGQWWASGRGLPTFRNTLIGRWDPAAGWRDVEAAEVTRSAVVVRRNFDAAAGREFVNVEIYGHRGGTTVALDDVSDPTFGPGLNVAYSVPSIGHSSLASYFPRLSGAVVTWFIDFRGHNEDDTYRNRSGFRSQAFGLGAADTLDVAGNGVADAIFGGNGLDLLLFDAGQDTAVQD